MDKVQQFLAGLGVPASVFAGALAGEEAAQEALKHVRSPVPIEVGLFVKASLPVFGSLERFASVRFSPGADPEFKISDKG